VPKKASPRASKVTLNLEAAISPSPAAESSLLDNVAQFADNVAQLSSRLSGIWAGNGTGAAPSTPTASTIDPTAAAPLAAHVEERASERQTSGGNGGETANTETTTTQPTVADVTA